MEKMSAMTPIERRCHVCNTSYVMEVPTVVAQALARPERPAMQDLWPEASAGQREQVISGTHDKCFADAFPMPL